MHIRRIQECPGAGNIRVDKFLLAMGFNMGFMQGCGVEYGIDSRHGLIDNLWVEHTAH